MDASAYIAVFVTYPFSIVSSSPDSSHVWWVVFRDRYISSLLFTHAAVATGPHFSHNHMYSVVKAASGRDHTMAGAINSSQWQ